MVKRNITKQQKGQLLEQKDQRLQHQHIIQHLKTEAKAMHRSQWIRTTGQQLVQETERGLRQRLQRSPAAGYPRTVAIPLTMRKEMSPTDKVCAFRSDDIRKILCYNQIMLLLAARN